MKTDVCGGVVSVSVFFKDPELYMMASVLSDKDYKQYVEMIEKGKSKKEIQKFVQPHKWDVL